MKVAFFSTKPYEVPFFQEKAKDTSYQFTFFEERLSQESVILAKEHQAICVFVHDDLSAAVLEALAELGIHIVLLRCAGFNKVDLKKAKEQSIQVANVPIYSPYAVAEHAICMMLTLNRKIHKAYNHVREGNFSLDGLLGFDIHGKTIGVIGTGHIGKCFAQIVSGFGVNLIGYDIAPDTSWSKKIGLEYLSLKELFQKADIISLHLPLNEDSKYLINKESISTMKDGVMLINTGRGALIKAEDTLPALKSGKIGYLGMDVYEEEENIFFQNLSSSIIQDDVLQRLLTFPNVIITSHQGFFTKEAMQNIATTTLSNLSQLGSKKPCPNLVSLPEKSV